MTQSPPLTRCTTTPVERISRDNILVGFGQVGTLAVPATTTSPWALALVTSVVGAATGWVIEEAARTARRRKRRR